MEGFEYYTPEEPSVKRVVFEVHEGAKEVVDFQQLQKEFMELTGQTPDPETYATLIPEEFEEWEFENQLRSREVSKHFGRAYNPEYELKELTDLLYVIFGYANSKGWDMAEAYKRVDANNKGRCVQPDGSVQFREDKKVMKNKGYPKVRLDDLV